MRAAAQSCTASQVGQRLGGGLQCGAGAVADGGCGLSALQRQSPRRGARRAVQACQQLHTQHGSSQQSLQPPRRSAASCPPPCATASTHLARLAVACQRGDLEVGVQGQQAHHLLSSVARGAQDGHTDLLPSAGLRAGRERAAAQLGRQLEGLGMAAACHASRAVAHVEQCRELRLAAALGRRRRRPRGQPERTPPARCIAPGPCEPWSGGQPAPPRR